MSQISWRTSVAQPQITVEYSESLADAFDRRGFALAFHPAAADLIASSVPAFKTRFYPIREAVIATGEPTEAMIHVDLAILPGRDVELKDRLAALALSTLAAHLKPAPDLNTRLTVEIRELSNHHKHVLTP